MDTQNSALEAEIATAQLEKLKAETALAEITRKKVKRELEVLEDSKPPRWWDIRAKALVQALAGGVVAGVLVTGFVLDHFLKIHELNKEKQAAIQAETEKQRKARIELEQKEENHRQTITSLQNELLVVQRDLAEIERILFPANGEILSADATAGERIAALKAAIERMQAATKTKQQALSSALQGLAEQRQEAPNGQENWFAVIASPYGDKWISTNVQDLKAETDHEVHVYKTVDRTGKPVYAITLGGYLSREEAERRVQEARDAGLAPTAYAWNSNDWGENIVDRFVK